MRLTDATFNFDLGMLSFDFSDGTRAFQQFVLGWHADAVVQALRKLADNIEAETRKAEPTTATPRSAATMSDAHMETADPQLKLLAKLAGMPNDTLFMRAVDKYKLGDGRTVYIGDNPVTFDNTREAKAVLMSRPWVIDHEDLRGQLWRVTGIECHCTFRIRAGRPIGVIVEPWDKP